MKVLFPLRFDAEKKPGGDVIQIRKYASFVEKAGGEVAFTSSLELDARGFDLVHASNIDRPETYFQVRSVASNSPGTPILLTPIHHSNVQRREYEGQGRRGVLRLANRLVPSYQFMEALKFLFRARKRRSLVPAAIRFLAVRQPQRFIAAKASLALLASESEKRWCEEDYQIQFAGSAILPNGLEDGSVYGNAGPRDIDVIMTGRIESRKNQIAVVRALSGSGLRLCLVGGLNESHAEYLTELKALVAKNPGFELLGPRPHAETLILLARSKVYISASWLEVMSLSDLEAFGAGCRVIASCHGSTKEVLGNLVQYVRPGSLEEIRHTLFAELAKDAPVKMDERKALIDKYLWTNLGQQLMQIYEREVSGKT